MQRKFYFIGGELDGQWRDVSPDASIHLNPEGGFAVDAEGMVSGEATIRRYLPARIKAAADGILIAIFRVFVAEGGSKADAVARTILPELMREGRASGRIKTYQTEAFGRTFQIECDSEAGCAQAAMAFRLTRAAKERATQEGRLRVSPEDQTRIMFAVDRMQVVHIQ